MSDPAAPPLRASESKPPSDRPRRARRALVAGVGLLALAGVAVALILVAAGGSAGRKRAVPRGNAATRTGPASRAAQTIKRLILTPTRTNQNAVGAAAIVRPAGGALVLLLQGQGLPVNQNGSYAVWLSNAPGDSRLLGFISPNAGSAGTFSSEAPLPPDTVRFHELLVTLETNSRPAAPGRAVLKAQLRLPPSAAG